MNHIAHDPEPHPEANSRSSGQRHVRTRRWVWAGLAILGLSVLVVLTLSFSPDQRLASPAPTSTPTPQVAMMQRSWILRPTLPATATQADKGAQVYRLVCSTCHGYGGEGLEYESWVATAPRTENCWQTRCHGGGHPVDGFALPRFIPPVVGSGKLTKFPNALALYEFVRATMPYQARCTMLDEEYWEVTAFLVRANDFDPIVTPLDPQRAAEVLLR